MSYPDYPNNRLIVGGVDITERFKMVLLDGYSLTPPEPKTYEVDIPGGNGVLDLTESLMGDTVYKNRKMEFSFAAIYVENFEKLKTEISNFLHGKEFDYKITMDPDYTYHGRFKVTTYTHGSYTNGIVGAIKISVDAEPFKYLDEQVVSVDGYGGKLINLPSGRKRVRPVIETPSYTKVIYDHKLLTLPEGTWTINDLLLTEGDNRLYICTYDVKNMTWKDFKTNEITWGQFKQQELFEWYKLHGNVNLIPYTWADFYNKEWNYLVNGVTWYESADETWDDLDELSWIDLQSRGWKWIQLKYKKNNNENSVNNVYIKYEWGDL